MNRMKKSVIVALLATLCSAAWAISLEEMLIHAARTGDMNILQVALNQVVNPNYTDASGKTALMYACEKMWYEGVVTLLEKGAHVEIKNKTDGKTAIMYAAQGKPMIVQKLIEEMANINAKDFERKTALMYAIEDENNNVIDLLLRQGADCLATDSYGNTVAMYAVRYKNRALLRELVKNPLIDWNKTNNKDVSPFILACRYGDINIVALLLQKAPIDVFAYNAIGRPILIQLLADKISPNIIKCIMEYCNPEEILSMTDHEGHDIKYWAEKQGYEWILAMLDEIEEKESRRNRAYSKSIRRNF